MNAEFDRISYMLSINQKETSLFDRNAVDNPLKESGKLRCFWVQGAVSKLPLVHHGPSTAVNAARNYGWRGLSTLEHGPRASVVWMVGSVTVTRRNSTASSRRRCEQALNTNPL